MTKLGILGDSIGRAYELSGHRSLSLVQVLFSSERVSLLVVCILKRFSPGE